MAKPPSRPGGRNISSGKFTGKNRPPTYGTSGSRGKGVRTGGKKN